MIHESEGGKLCIKYKSFNAMMVLLTTDEMGISEYGNKLESVLLFGRTQRIASA